jgi:tripartite-type tricarboxylate transporter receptor subunit TctC
MIIPFAAGGPIDTIGRLMAEKLGAELGATIVVDNRASGNGVVAGQAVARGPKDGSMILFAAGSNLTIAPHLDPNMPYDVRTAFAPVTRVVLNGSGLAIHGGIPANTVPELIEWTRRRGGPLRMASNGMGSIAHAWLELFRRATGLDILHVPYRGAGPAIIATISGQVDGMFADLLVQLPHVEAGRLKVIGLIGRDRHPSRPEIPTIAEQGYPGVDGLSWSGIVAPAGVPEAITNRYADAVARVMRDPAIVARLSSFGAAPATMTPAAFGQLLAGDLDWWGRTIRENNITVE